MGARSGGVMGLAKNDALSTKSAAPPPKQEKEQAEEGMRAVASPAPADNKRVDALSQEAPRRMAEKQSPMVSVPAPPAPAASAPSERTIARGPAGGGDAVSDNLIAKTESDAEPATPPAHHDEDREAKVAQTERRPEAKAGKKSEVGGDRVADLRRRLVTARGADRQPLLEALCDAEFAARRMAEAEKACDMLVKEFPSSRQATLARDRMLRARTLLLDSANQESTH
jgi:hypothetical protein